MTGIRMKLSLALCILATCSGAYAQQRAPRLDFALGYVAEHGTPLGHGGNFWLNGGSAELGVDAWRGWGIAVNVTRTRSNSFGTSNLPLTLLTTTFGPRYRYYFKAAHGASLFGEGLIGEVHGLDSLFPAPGGATNSALALATQAGGGLDFSLTRHFAIRAVEASWVRMQLPNSSTNVQNDLRLGAGVAVKF